MQAIILATNEGSQLPPLTDTLPGPLLPTVDRPVLAMTVEILARAGLKRLLVSLYNGGGPIAAYLGSGRRWGVDIDYVTQRDGWGSAGALKWAGRLLSETFLVLPGAALIDLDVEAALAFHRAHGGPATVIVAGPAAGAPLRSADGGRLVAADGAPLRPCGAYIFEPGVMQHIAARTYADIVGDLIPALLAAGEPVYGYSLEGYWNPLDSLACFHEAQQVLLYSAYSERAPEQAQAGPAARVRYPALSSRQIAPGIWVGLNHSIHPSVKLAPPVYIGENTYIGREVELGAGSVIGSNVVIDDQATIGASTILAGTYVGQLVRVEGRIVTDSSLSDPESGETIRVVDPFLLSRADAESGAPDLIGRAFSFVVALALLIALSPLALIAWLLAALASGGRPLRGSPRVGQRSVRADGSYGLHTFDLLGFETLRGDGGQTRIGRWLERWEIARIPELINVLRGDMAMVGVKPLRQDEVASLSEEWHQKRHEAPAGFTGLWYQQTEPDSDLDAVIIADVYYTATRTWRSDLLLLLRTPAIWVRRHARRTAPPNAVIRADNARSL
jgi:NDP-sugar pyrophosphorylase family protein